ncbi:glycoside hydrolase family 32 protein [Vibrio hannami]|uniref:glycoside hydrolase family 32 protein n=1 Tax=Vibrio hannami TaxID=2717094 RepID=UPI00240EB197|nr:glycoside hydrolase family 32 protein [Vibrio hannami]MDG3085417.1 glycoside hydrolase family 32 protein [Vibrio hannami]
MLLERYVEECGGFSNLNRVLAPDNRLILEYVNPELLKLNGQRGELNSMLRQVAYSRTEEISDQSLTDLCARIDTEQKNDAENHLTELPCEYRPLWHVSPPQGLLNDPNGFIFHEGKYHLFYQWYPYRCEHKDKYWAHLTSKDLIHWDWNPLALTPSSWFDSHGVFSGHALSHGNELLLFYTGNVRIGEARDRHTTQCIAKSKDGINFEKVGPVIGELPPGVTPHCRDPKVFKHGDEWVMLLGAQTEDLKGRVAVYKSDDLYHWDFFKLCGEEYGDFGYMWECPDFFELNGQSYTVIGPQGIDALGKHHTIPHHNGIAKVEIDTDANIEFGEFEHLDYGFDFYAPQTALSEDGRRLMVGWMGLPDETDHPSVDNGWIHQLTSVRELIQSDGKLIQRPIKELEALRGNQQSIVLQDSEFDTGSNQYELVTELSWGQSLQLFKGNEYQVNIELDADLKVLRLDRSCTLIREGDTIREVELGSSTVSLQILVDTSSIEVFINNGEKVLTGRIFVPTDSTNISVKGKAELQLINLKQK